MADETKLTAATRIEKLLDNIAGGENDVTPATRLEKFLSYIADAMEGGGGSGGGGGDSSDIIVLDVAPIPEEDIPQGNEWGFVIDADINDYKDKKAIFLRSKLSEDAPLYYQYGQILNLDLADVNPLYWQATVAYGVEIVGETDDMIYTLYTFQPGANLNMEDSYYANKMVYLKYGGIS